MHGGEGLDVKRIELSVTDDITLGLQDVAEHAVNVLLSCQCTRHGCVFCVYVSLWVCVSLGACVTSSSLNSVEFVKICMDSYIPCPQFVLPVAKINPKMLQLSAFAYF